MTTYACNYCDFIGYQADLKPAVVPKLQPGEVYVAPLGVCPECGHVVPHDALMLGYPKTHFTWQDSRPERGNLTQFQRDCLLKALSLLTPKHPGFTGSPEIGCVLEAADLPLPPKANATFGTTCPGPYLKSWVLPLLQGALYGPVYVGQRAHAATDAAAVRGKLAAAEWNAANAAGGEA